MSFITEALAARFSGMKLNTLKLSVPRAAQS
jgi:hypothetical protein